MHINAINTNEYKIRRYNSQLSYTGDETTQNNSGLDKIRSMSGKEKAGWAAGIGTFFIAAGTFFSKFKKSPSEAQKDILKLTKKLIKQLKPQDKELAKIFYPAIIKNSEGLQLKPEQYNDIMDAISKDNREFMIAEGFDILGSKADKIKKITQNSTSDLLTVISSLNKTNKNVFASVFDNIEQLKIADCEDFQGLLEEINPQKHDYIFTKLLQYLTPHEKSLGINTPERYGKIFNHITPETESIIPKVAKFEAPQKSKIDKFGIIMSATKDNKDCVMPLLNNIDKFNYNSFDIKNILKWIKNKNSHSIDVAANNIENINNLKIKTEEIFKLSENKAQADILDSVLKNPQFFKIENQDNIKNYIINLKPENIEFITKDLVPKLEKNADVFGLNTPDQIIEVLNNINPKTLPGIEIIEKYAQELGENISYPSLLSALTENNINKLPKLMEKIKETEVWDNFMVNSNDFQKLLDSI